MKKATRSDIKKAARFQKRINDLQFDIYGFVTYLEGKGLGHVAELANESAFEFQEAALKMQDATRALQAANYGPQ